MQKNILGFIILLLLAAPYVSHADPIISVDLYTPFSSVFIRYNNLLYSTILFGGLALELILIFLFVRKSINWEQKNRAVIKIFIPLIILNLFTISVTQIIALFVAFFAELFPIIVEFLIIYIIFKEAKNKNLIINLPTKTDVLIVVFFANLLSFGFGLAVNYAYFNCERYRIGYFPVIRDINNVPDYCFYIPFIGKESREEKLLDERRIKECEELVDNERSGEQSNKRVDCYANYAVENNDMNLCFWAEHFSPFFRGDSNKWGAIRIEEVCYIKVASKTLNYKTCDDLNKNDYGCSETMARAQCYLAVAIAKQDPSICGKIKGESPNCKWIKEIIDECYSEIKK